MLSAAPRVKEGASPEGALGGRGSILVTWWKGVGSLRLLVALSSQLSSAMTSIAERGKHCRWKDGLD